MITKTNEIVWLCTLDEILEKMSIHCKLDETFVVLRARDENGKYSDMYFIESIIINDNGNTHEAFFKIVDKATIDRYIAEEKDIQFISAKDLHDYAKKDMDPLILRECFILTELNNGNGSITNSIFPLYTETTNMALLRGENDKKMLVSFVVKAETTNYEGQLSDDGKYARYYKK